MIFGVHTQA